MKNFNIYRGELFVFPNIFHNFITRNYYIGSGFIRKLRKGTLSGEKTEVSGLI